MSIPKYESVNSKANVMLWLLSGCLLIFLMVIVGGITRLTGSGLSITEWKVITGIIPPLNENDWLKEFHAYMATPQFEKINSHFGLEDFKEIYWWEYIHRLIGRLLGFVFLIPFVWFVFSRQMSPATIKKSLLLFFMGGLQGFIGWYMVKSGLVDQPHVSHLRLALHLSTAFATFALTFWFALDIMDPVKIKKGEQGNALKGMAAAILIVLSLQIVYGAFVAGLKAGYIYNTWPMMEGQYVADAVTYGWSKFGAVALRDNMAMVQFIHRNLAIILTLMICWVAYKALRTMQLSNSQQLAVKLVLGAVFLQFVLGVITLLYAVPVALGVIHQAGAFVLLTCVIYLLHTVSFRAAAK